MLQQNSYCKNRPFEQGIGFRTGLLDEEKQMSKHEAIAFDM